MFKQIINPYAEQRDEHDDHLIEQRGVAPASAPAVKTMMLPQHTVVDFVRGDYVFQIFVLQARELRPRDRDGMSDPYVAVSVMDDKVQKTDIKEKTLNCIWDSLFFWDVKVEDPLVLERGKIKFSVFDNNKIMSDVIIGVHEFDIASIILRSGHFVSRQWVPLFDPSEPKSGVQGFLQVSITILRPGDRPPGIADSETAPTAGSEDYRDIGDYRLLRVPKNINCTYYVLNVDIVKAEGLPRMDVFTASRDAVDAFVRLDFGGARPRETAVISDANPEWYTSLKVPVILPTWSDNIKISLWDRDLTSADDIVAVVSPSLSFRELPCYKPSSNKRSKISTPLAWFNLYGAPQGKEKGDADLMNRGLMEGSTYRGRVLLRSYITGPVELKALDDSSLANEGTNVDAEHYPKNDDYVLSFCVYEASSLPSTSYVAVEVSIGNKAEYSRPAEVKKGFAQWNVGFDRVFRDLPVNKDEIPDVLISIWQCNKNGKRKKRISYRRVKAADIFVYQTRPLYQSQQVQEYAEDNEERSESWKGFTADSISAVGGKDDTPGFLFYSAKLTVYSTAIESTQGESTSSSRVPDWRPVDLADVTKDLLKEEESRKTSDNDFEDDRSEAGTEDVEELSRAVYSFNTQRKQSLVTYQLNAWILQGRDLPAADASGMSDTYCEIRVGDVAATTPVRRDTMFPQWGETKLSLRLNLPAIDRTSSHERMPVWPQASITVFDKDKIGKDDKLGQGFVPLAEVYRDGNAHAVWYPLFGASRNDRRGEVYGVIQIHPRDEKLPKEPSVAALRQSEYKWKIVIDILGLRKMPVNRVGKTLLAHQWVIEFDLGDGRPAKTLEWPDKDKKKKITDSEAQMKDSPNIEQIVVIESALRSNPLLAPALTVRLYKSGIDKQLVGICTIPLQKAYEEARNRRWDSGAQSPVPMPSPAMRPYDTAPLPFPSAYNTPASVNPPQTFSLGANQWTNSARPSIEMPVRTNSGFVPIQDQYTTARSRPSIELASRTSPVEVYNERPQSPMRQRSSPITTTTTTTSTEQQQAAVRLPEVRIEIPDSAVPRPINVPPATTSSTTVSYGPLGLPLAPFSSIPRIGGMMTSLQQAPQPVKTVRKPLNSWDPFDLPFLRDRRFVGHELEKDLTDSYFEEYILTKGRTNILSGLLGSNDPPLIDTGKLKAKVVIQPDHEPLPKFEEYKRERVVVRVYVLRGVNVIPKDANGKSDCYVAFEFGSTVDKRKNNVQKATLQPRFFERFETQTILPGISTVKISVWDKDVVDKDDLIGETSLDLERRWFSKKWQQEVFKRDGETPPAMCSPVERRTLIDPKTGNSAGQIDVFVEILTTEDATKFPPVNIGFPTSKFELRAVIWKAQKMACKDPFTKMNDLYITGTLEAGGEFKTVREETDVHLRAKGGKGSFNWRMVFPIELPLQQPVFKLQAFDKDLIGQDNIGETVIDLSNLFRDALSRREELILNSDCISLPKRFIPFFHPTTGQAVQGELEVQFDLLPSEVAQRRAAGKNREEPNRYPVLPEPDREKLNLLRPDLMLKMMVGPELMRKVLALGCVGGACVCMFFIGPLVAGDVIGSVIAAKINKS